MTLYLRHRPLTFADLIGQDGVQTILQNALAKERIAHAYLFSGPRGTGKTSTARIFARAVCCLDPKRGTTKKPAFEPCNECENCRLVLTGETPDIIEIDAASNRGVEEIRTLREQAQYGPLLLPRKIYIIDEAHMLTGEAFNALLKTLEEPPAHCLFILATTEPHKIPLTVRSRCQLIRFQQGSVESITAKLDKIVAKEGWQAEAGVTALIAQHAEGGFRDAETLLEQIAVRQASMELSAVQDILGELESSLCQSLVVACLRQDQDEVESLLAKHFSDPSLRYEHILNQLIGIVRAKTPLSSLTIYFLEQLLEAYIVLRYSPSPSLPLHLACLSTCTRSSIQPAATPLGERVSYDTSTVVPSPQKPHAKEVVAPAPAPSREDSLPAPTPFNGDIRKAWKNAVSGIQSTNNLLAQTLRESVFHSSEHDTITVHVRYKFHLDKLNDQKNRRAVQKLLEDQTGLKWTINYVLKSTLPKRDGTSSAPAEESNLSKEVAAIFTAAPKPRPNE